MAGWECKCLEGCRGVYFKILLEGVSSVVQSIRLLVVSSGLCRTIKTDIALADLVCLISRVLRS